MRRRLLPMPLTRAAEARRAAAAAEEDRAAAEPCQATPAEGQEWEQRRLAAFKSNSAPTPQERTGKPDNLQHTTRVARRLTAKTPPPPPPRAAAIVIDLSCLPDEGQALSSDTPRRRASRARRPAPKKQALLGATALRRRSSGSAAKAKRKKRVGAKAKARGRRDQPPNPVAQLRQRRSDEEKRKSKEAALAKLEAGARSYFRYGGTMEALIPRLKATKVVTDRELARTQIRISGQEPADQQIMRITRRPNAPTRQTVLTVHRLERDLTTRARGGGTRPDTETKWKQVARRFVRRHAAALHNPDQRPAKRKAGRGSKKKRFDAARYARAHLASSSGRHALATASRTSAQASSSSHGKAR